MRLADFIKQNKTELDEAISRVRDFVPRQAGCFCHRKGTDHYHTGEPLNNEDRRQWILNDEGLYRWARREGVRI